jgi:hypothetical protein
MSETALFDHLRRVFATFDAKDVSTLAGFDASPVYAEG